MKKSPTSPTNDRTARAHTHLRKVYLHPGQLFVSSTPVTVTTILGSCVSVTLWDSRNKIGGINHFLVPHRMSGRQGSPRAANVAISELLRQMLELGASRRHLEAGIYGGACVLDAFSGRTENLGKQNSRVAQVILEFERIPVVRHDIGGRYGRKVLFDTGDGNVVIKPIGGQRGV